MLDNLLRILREGSAYTYGDLAVRLGVSEVMIEDMLENLARLGYLRPMAQACESHCASCHMSGACAVGAPGRIWVLTEKGGRTPGV